MTHKLVEISRSDLPKLQDLYLRDWPNNLIGFYTLNNFILWCNKDPNIKNLSFYSLDGEWNDGTFLIVDRYQLFFNTLNSSNNDRLLVGLSLLDWSKGLKVSTFLERHRPIVLEVIASKNLKKMFDSITCTYYLPKCDAKNISINCPDDIVLKTLSNEDAVIANDHWPNKHIGSEYFLKRLAEWNPNIGAYKKDGNELVAWCFRLQAGPLGALQTKPAHMRQGFGSLVTRAMIKQLEELDQDTFACVDLGNEASRKMFEKLGFVEIEKTCWLRTFPTIEDFQWVDNQ